MLLLDPFFVHKLFAVDERELLVHPCNAVLEFFDGLPGLVDQAREIHVGDVLHGLVGEGQGDLAQDVDVADAVGGDGFDEEVFALLVGIRMEVGVQAFGDHPVEVAELPALLQAHCRGDQEGVRRFDVGFFLLEVGLVGGLGHLDLFCDALGVRALVAVDVGLDELGFVGK